jgi:asparagine synthase (glutamine-hydrolysing)
MCGILGSINIPATPGYLDDIKHRGPDAEGAKSFCVNNHLVNLLHRRLSIVDLSEAGSQPMLSIDNKGCIVFNGEIYNHNEIRTALSETKYRGHSDTESILNLFRNKNINEALGELNGIFGIAYLDIENQKLFLARDRYGVKPLYYYYGAGKLVFSSEIRPIKSVINTEIDRGTLLNSMRMRYTPSPFTIYNEISKVEPGQLITIDLSVNNLAIQKEYFVKTPDKIGSVQGDYRKLIQTYGDFFEKAVERQLMADVDIGILLSGGVDSALVAAIAKQKTNGAIKAFTVGFEDQNSGVDEIAYAQQTADIIGLEHHATKISFSDFLE